MFRPFIASVLFLSAVLLPAAPAVPLVNLVDDQTLFALSVTDTPALLRGWDASPVAATWNDPQIVKFLSPLRATLDIDAWDEETKTATGLTVRELLALAEGEALVALPAFTLAQLEGEEPPPFLVALEVGGQGAKIEKILADSAAKKSVAVESETFAGVKVNMRPVTGSDEDEDGENNPTPKVIVWAIVDGVWIISPHKETVFSAINALQQGGHAAALGKSERFLRTRQRIGDAQSLTYVNFTAIYPLIQEAVLDAKAKSTAKPNLLGVDAESIFNALGLDALGEGYLAMAMNATETRLDFGVTYTEERGLLKVLAYQPGPAPRPDWVPAKWASVSTTRFSWPKAYAGLEEVLDSVSPVLAGVVQGNIRGFNKKLGIDLVRDFLGSLGDDLISAHAVPPGLEPGAVPPWTEMDQLIAFSLVNEPAFVRSLEALKNLAGPAATQMFTERDYLGHTIYTFEAPAGGRTAKQARGFSYAIANRTFLVGIGSPATVESALQGMSSPQDSFWQRSDVKAALAEVPDDAVALQVQDLGLMMASFVEVAVQLQARQNADRADGDKKTYVDETTRPDMETIRRYWGLAAGYATRTPEGLFSTTRIAHPQK